MSRQIRDVFADAPEPNLGRCWRCEQRITAGELCGPCQQWMTDDGPRPETATTSEWRELMTAAHRAIVSGKGELPALPAGLDWKPQPVCDCGDPLTVDELNDGALVAFCPACGRVAEERDPVEQRVEPDVFQPARTSGGTPLRLGQRVAPWLTNQPALTSATHVFAAAYGVRPWSEGAADWHPLTPVDTITELADPARHSVGITSVESDRDVCKVRWTCRCGTPIAKNIQRADVTVPFDVLSAMVADEMSRFHRDQVTAWYRTWAVRPTESPVVLSVGDALAAPSRGPIPVAFVHLDRWDRALRDMHDTARIMLMAPPVRMPVVVPLPPEDDLPAQQRTPADVVGFMVGPNPPAGLGQFGPVWITETAQVAYDFRRRIADARSTRAMWEEQTLAPFANAAVFSEPMLDIETGTR